MSTRSIALSKGVRAGAGGSTAIDGAVEPNVMGPEPGDAAEEMQGVRRDRDYRANPVNAPDPAPPATKLKKG